MNLPEWYIDWITRVSSIVSYVYPFKGTDAEIRYLDWLADNVNPKWKRGFAINPQEYMDEACNVWTYVHLQMENYIEWKKPDKRTKNYKLHKNEIDWWIKYIDKLKELYPKAIWKPEQIVRDEFDRYQWTIDLIRIDEGNKTVYLYDWKTFWIAKKKWWLPNKYKKPSQKLVKLSLQLSLYANIYIQKWYKIWGIYGVYLHESGCYEYKLNQWTTDDINIVLARYFLSSYLPRHILNIVKEIIIINHIIKDMIIEIRKPTIKYWYVNIIIDMYKEQNGATLEDKIKEAEKAFDLIIK